MYENDSGQHLKSAWRACDIVGNGKFGLGHVPLEPESTGPHRCSQISESDHWGVSAAHTDAL